MERISEAHFKVLGEESAINAEVLEAAGVYSADKDEAYKQVGVASSGILFPYIGFDQKLLGWRLRKDEVDEGYKYHQKKETSLSCYFLSDDVERILNANERIIIVEGEKKLLAVKSLDEFRDKAVVSVPGCWNWTGGKTGKLYGPWKEIPWKGRKVTLAFDSDYFFKPSVHAPYNKLMKELLLEGASVDMVDLRGDEPNEKNGTDDFIKKYGSEKFVKRVQNPLWKHRLGWEDFEEQWASRQGRSDDFIREELEAKILDDEISIEEGLNIIKKSTGMGKGITRRILKEIRAEWKLFTPNEKSEIQSSRELELNRGEKGPDAFFRDLATMFLSNDDRLFYLPDEKALVSINPLTHEPFYMRTPEHFRFHYSQKIDFIQYKMNGKSDGYELLPATEMKVFFNSITNYAKLREINLTMDTPIYYRGELVTLPGYDQDLKVYYTGKKFDTFVSEFPTIDYFLGTFPFEDEVSKVNALGALLQTVLFRYELQGERPMILIEGDGPNLGKTTLAHCIAWIAFGVYLPTVTYEPRDEEFEKRLGACYRSASGAIIDNVRSDKIISSACLERFLTDPKITTRKLGHSENLVFQNNVQNFLTVNDAKLSEDLFTRSLLITLAESQLEKMPYDFSPREFVKENREKFILELLSLVSNWQEVGAPRPVINYPKYRKYASLIGGILEANGYEGFLSNYDDGQVKLDPLSENVLDTATHFLSSINRGFPTEEKPPREWVQEVETFVGGKLFDEGQSPKSKETLMGRTLHRMQNKTFKWRLATGEKVRVRCNSRKNHSKVRGNFFYSFTILEEESLSASKSHTAGIASVSETNNELQVQ